MRARSQTGLVSVGAQAVQRLYPGYFALVMATGIVSNALYLLDFHLLSNALLGVNLIAYPVLLAMTLLRLALYPADFWRDLTNPEVVFSFFTFVAGTDVLGVQFYLRHYELLSQVLWLLALVVWVVLSYFSFSVLTFIGPSRGIDVVHGGWLIAIVGTQSLVLLGTLLAPRFGGLAPVVFLATHSVWGVGVVLYGIFVTLWCYRIFFVRMEAWQMTPLFWVVMGAAAISTNAGSCLITCAPMVAFLETLRPFVEGSTLVLWAWSTWLIPLFVIFGIWKHLVKRVPLAYDPMYWSLVFPLGMYTVATYRLSVAADYSPLRLLPIVTVWVALGAWGLTMFGLLRRLCAATLAFFRRSQSGLMPTHSG